MRRYLFTLISLLSAINLFAQIDVLMDDDFDDGINDDVEVVNIENPYVRAYMDDRTYESNPDISVTVVSKYLNGTELEWPAGKTVTWTPTVSASDISEIRIVAEDVTGNDSQVFYTSSTAATSYVIRNLLPNCTYDYWVEEVQKNGTVTEVKSGTFETVGQLRMIQVGGVHNVRDMGGWSSMLGSRLKYGYLYRSGNLDRITATGKHDFIDNLKVAGELDLRAESKLKCSALGEDKDFLLIPHSSYTVGMKSKSEVYVKDIEWIVQRVCKENKSVDWHCAIGCDRCGTVSLLIGGLLGMYKEDLCRDFELSNFAGHKRYRNAAASMVRFIEGYGSPGDDLAECFYKYWLSIGASREDLDALREYMIEGYIDPHQR